MFGATGGLGMEIAQGLVTAKDFDAKKAVVRDPSSEKAQALTKLGWDLVQVKDMNDSKALEGALDDAKVVVSTLSGNDMVALEANILRAAKKAGASLFVPSQFGVDYRRWGTEFPFLAGKKAVLDVAEKEGMPVLTVFNGYFSDWIFGFFTDLQEKKVTWIGDGNDKITWTRRSDIGFVLAKALADPELASGGTLSVQGDYMSFNDATQLLGDALGQRFEVTYMDPEQAKKEETEMLKKGLDGDVGAFFGAFKFHLMGEPARGNDGSDLNSSYNNYGVKMQSLEDVFKSGVYSS